MKVRVPEESRTAPDLGIGQVDGGEFGWASFGQRREGLDVRRSTHEIGEGRILPLTRRIDLGLDGRHDRALRLDE